LPKVPPERIGDDGERQNEREGRVEQGRGAVAVIPARRPIAFCIDEQGNAPDLIGDPDAAVGPAQRKCAAIIGPTPRMPGARREL